MKTILLYILLLLPSLVLGETLKIEENPVLNSTLKELSQAGTTPEIYPVSEQYRLDLTLTDLVDQATLTLEDRPDLLERLDRALHKYENFPDFLGWFQELKLIAEEDQHIKKKLDGDLYMQFYTPSGIALIPNYKTFDFKKVLDNAKLQRIKKYNKYAGDPEGQGLLAAFAKKDWQGFYTHPLTVTKMKEVSVSELKRIYESYYEQLIKLYVKHDSSVSYKKSHFGIKVDDRNEVSQNAVKLFKAIQELPSKYQILFLLSQKVQDIPFDSGLFVLTPTFIDTHFDEIDNALKEITLDQVLHSDDDDYLLALRNYIKKNSKQIEKDLATYNSANTTEHKLIWKNHDKKPGRIEAMANVEVLLLLYPNSPWFKGDHASLFNRNGKQIYLNESIGKKIGRFFKTTGKNLIKSENYLSLLAGGVAFVVSDSNLPVAISTRNLVKEAIKTAKYDHEWKEFFKDAPNEVINAFLLSSGFAPGRFFKIVALGAGQGLVQSLFTGEDLRTGALVGASLNIIQYYILPTSWARPMTKGYDAKALAMNRKLELLEGSIKGLIQGAATAAIDGNNIAVGAVKGTAFGFVSTQMVIWFLGTRYNPYKGWTDDQVDEMIRLENDFQNSVGRGGTYAINRQLILDANYRVGGWLPKIIDYSITLPGNVGMNDRSFTSLKMLTHEAQHLMQQHQSGVFGFYLFRYIPTYLQSGYIGHPDENFLFGIHV